MFETSLGIDLPSALLLSENGERPQSFRKKSGNNPLLGFGQFQEAALRRRDSIDWDTRGEVQVKLRQIQKASKATHACHGS